MIRHLALGSLLLMPGLAHADPVASSSVGPCIVRAADVYRVPPAIIVILLSVEGGSLHHVTSNTNGTVDIGPMQVNQFWVPSIARHWHATEAESYNALRDSFCANVAAGTWILRQNMDEANGDFWEGVARYHSHTSVYKMDYLRKVLAQIRRLVTLAAKTTTASPPGRPNG